jgi:site-specific DNA recombinase
MRSRLLIYGYDFRTVLIGVVSLRFVIYARISGQEQSVYSLESQISECKAFAERLGHELVETYIDDGESAKDLQRPDIQRLMDDLKKNKFDLVVCWKLDRLTRDVIDGLTLIINLFKRKHNVTFMSVTEDIKTETSDDVMMLTIRLSMAQSEREKIKERVTLGQLSRAKTGKRNSIAKPYGYDIDRDMNLTPNEEEAEIVRRIYQWYVEGHGRQKIANMLNEEGVPAPRGKIWFDAIIGVLIGNPGHIGANHWKRKEDPEEARIIVHGMHEPIVPVPLFELAVTVKARRREGDMNQSSYDFCFSSIVKCGDCGRSYHGKQLTKVKHGKQTRHYRCSGKYHSNRCNASDISEIKLTKLFLDAIKNIETEAKTPENVVSGRDTAKDKKKLEKQINDSAAKKDRYTRGMGSGVIDFDKFIGLMKEENDKQKQWQAELDEINMQTPSHKKRFSDIAKYIEELGTKWDGMTVLQRKVMLSKMFKYIVIKKENGVWEMGALKTY